MDFSSGATKRYICNINSSEWWIWELCRLSRPVWQVTLRRTIITTNPPAEKPKRTRSSTATAKAAAAKAPSASPVVAGAATSTGSVRKKAAASGPKGKVKREPVSPDVLAQSLTLITTSLDDDKAENIVVIDLAGRASFADKMVIATGLADRQIAAMAQHIERKLKEIGIKRVLIEGANGSDWVLLDTGDIIVHLFKPEARELYGLEKMWGAELDDGNAEAVPTA
ncbi:hypothetical protein AA0312_0951 [Acetobacter tropicalis NRIC 0312]|nr:hypothetical protein AA0312_0951 [Acetobacter tropicalis NRIC 0312]